MQESVYQGVIFLLSDAVVRFVLNSRVDHIVAERRLSTVQAHTSVLRLPEIDCRQPNFLDWYSYDNRSADVREVLYTHHGGRSHIGSKSQARAKVKVVNLINF